MTIRTKVATFLAVLPILAPAAVDAADVVLRIDSWISPKHVQNSIVFPAFIKQLEAATDGKVTAKVSYPPQTNPRTMYDRARTGVADIAWGLHDYTPGRFPINELISLPGSGAKDAYEQSVAYWRVHEKYLSKYDEHKGAEILAVFSMGPGVMSSRKDIPNFEAMKGLKVRVQGGLTSKIAVALGMVPVPTPGTKMYEVLSAGIVDAAFTGMEGKRVFRLDEVAKYTLVYPDGLFFATVFITMNSAKFKSLKPEYQAAIRKISGENLAKIAGKAWAGSDARSYKASVADNIMFIVAKGEMENKMKVALGTVTADWIEGAKKRGVSDPAAIIKALRDEVLKVRAETK